MGVALLLAVGGCATSGPFISQNGPSQGDLVTNAQLRAQPLSGEQTLQYALVPLNLASVALLGTEDVPQTFADAPTETRSADGAIGIGDQVSVTVFESDGGGLFLPREGGTRAGNFVTIPTQQVGKDGTISVPYAGTVRVAGQSPQSVQTLVEQRLANRALEPQVILTVVDRRAAQVSVLGEVTNATHFSLDPGGARIMEAIARAGGPKYPAYESMVTLQRNGATQKALLSEIALNPQQNVQLRPNDVIYVSHEPRYFLALGAIGQSSSLGPINRRFPFNDSRLTLADAMAQAGGLEDDRANPTGVFVYRSEPRSTVVALGVEPATVKSLPDLVPTVFVLNLRDPAGFFYAKRFAVRNEDVIFVSNAPATDLAKFLSLIGSVTGSTSAVRSTVN